MGNELAIRATLVVILSSKVVIVTIDTTDTTVINKGEVPHV